MGLVVCDSPPRRLGPAHTSWSVPLPAGPGESVPDPYLEANLQALESAPPPSNPVPQSISLLGGDAICREIVVKDKRKTKGPLPQPHPFMTGTRVKGARPRCKPVALLRGEGVGLWGNGIQSDQVPALVSTEPSRLQISHPSLESPRLLCGILMC